jgi:hypothetical protein
MDLHVCAEDIKEIGSIVDKQPISETREKGK